MSYKYEVIPSQYPANPVLAKIKIVQLIFLSSSNERAQAFPALRQRKVQHKLSHWILSVALIFSGPMGPMAGLKPRIQAQRLADINSTTLPPEPSQLPGEPS